MMLLLLLLLLLLLHCLNHGLCAFHGGFLFPELLHTFGQLLCLINLSLLSQLPNTRRQLLQLLINSTQLRISCCLRVRRCWVLCCHCCRCWCSLLEVESPVGPGDSLIALVHKTLQQTRKLSLEIGAVGCRSLLLELSLPPLWNGTDAVGAWSQVLLGVGEELVGTQTAQIVSAQT